MTGLAILVEGKVVAWFSEWTEESSQWCTENYFGKWLVFRAEIPKLIPLSEEEYEELLRQGAEFLTKLNEKS